MHETNETQDEIILKSAALMTHTHQSRCQSKDRPMFKLSPRVLIIPVGAIATIAALSTQNVTHATTRGPVTSVNEQIVDCTQENRKTVDICIIADSVSR
jgi:hypothetical protein